MALPWSTFVKEGDEVAFRPASDTPAGTPIELASGWWGVCANDVKAGALGHFRVTGTQRCLKKTASDAFAIGDRITFDGTGFVASVSGEWRVRSTSLSGARHVIADMNVPNNSGSGGGGSADGQLLVRSSASVAPTLGASPTISPVPTGINGDALIEGFADVIRYWKKVSGSWAFQFATFVDEAQTPGLFIAKATGAATAGVGEPSDDAALIAAVTAAKAYGRGATIRLASTFAHKTFHLVSGHDMGVIDDFTLEKSADLEVIRSNANGSFLIGAIYTPMTMAGSGTYSPLSANQYLLRNPSITLAAGDWVATWADNEILDSSQHQLGQPHRPCEFKRIDRQYLTASTWTLNTADGTAGTFAITVNVDGVIQTASGIAFSADAATIQTALRALSNVGSPNLTVTGSKAAGFTITASGPLLNTINAMSLNKASLTGATTNTVLNATATTPINSWLFADPTFDPHTTNPKLVKIPVCRGFKCRNFAIRMGDGLTPSGAWLRLGGCVDFTLENVRNGDVALRKNAGQIEMLLCGLSRCNHVVIGDHEDPNVGQQSYYGITHSICSRIMSHQISFGAVRHGFTSAARDHAGARYGCNLDGEFVDCTWRANGRQQLSSPNAGAQTASVNADFHAETARYTIRGGKMYACGIQAAFNIRSREINMIDTEIILTDEANIGYVRARDFSMIGVKVHGGQGLIVEDAGTEPNVDRVHVLHCFFDDMFGPPLRFHTGTDHRAIGNVFRNVGKTATNSPFVPKCCILVRSLTNSSATITICDNHAPKYSNDHFLYASTLDYGQLAGYEGNTGLSGYEGIGIARTRSASDPDGTPSTKIDVVFDWEAKYAHRNGKDRLHYCTKASHNLTAAHVSSPLLDDLTRLDDTVGGTPFGFLLEVWDPSRVIVTPAYLPFDLDPGMINGTYNAGSDGSDLHWDLSTAGGKYVSNKPGDSVLTGPTIYCNTQTANTLQVRAAIPAGSGGGGSVEWAAVEW